MEMKQLLSITPQKPNAVEMHFKDVIIFPSVICGGGPSES